MRWRVTGVVVLLVLAGCGGLDGPAGTETLTPAPVPADAPDEGPGATVAPGVWADGRLDAEVLAAAHRAAIEDAAFVWRASRTRAGRLGNVSTRTESHEEIAVVNDTVYRHTSAEIHRIDGQGQYHTQYAEYADGSSRFVRTRAIDRDDVRYERTAIDGDGDRLRNATVVPVERYLDVASVTVTPVESEDSPRYRLRGRDPRGGWGDGLDNYSVTATVAPSGLVRTLSVQYAQSRGESVERLRYRFTFDRLGVASVERPAWVSTARERIDNGTAVSVSR